MNVQEKRFVQTVWDYYKKNNRNHLLWRRTKDPYKILVSEIMLQQTQVERVLPKYKEFIKIFPTVSALADARFSEMFALWQGLGYNRRAKMLHSCAQIVHKQYKGVFPREYKELLSLPGVGPYTAAAVSAFAYNIAVPCIETNIRTVYLYHFFKNKQDVTEKDILAKVTKTLDTERVREWYAALMDYGVFLKQEFGNQNTRIAGYTKQSTFKGSDREIRGAIMRELSGGHQSLAKLPFEKIRIEKQIEALVKEDLVEKAGRGYRIVL